MSRTCRWPTCPEMRCASASGSPARCAGRPIDRLCRKEDRLAPVEAEAEPEKKKGHPERCKPGDADKEPAHRLAAHQLAHQERLAEGRDHGQERPRVDRRQ